MLPDRREDRMNQQQHEGRDAYVAFQEGTRLLADDNAHAAVVALERARALEPAQGSVREALARAYFRAGRFAQAEEEFQAAMRLDPKSFEAAYFYARACVAQGKAEEAVKWFERAIAVRPDDFAEFFRC